MNLSSINKAELIKAIKEQCERSLIGIEIDEALSKECTFCGSNLIEYQSGKYPTFKFKCHQCGNHLDYYQAFNLTHRDIRQGVEDPFRECEECGENSMMGYFCTNSECGYELDPNTDDTFDENNIRKIREELERG
ncbi:hypothetical protein [Conservatibacter flavescens]|uniref:Uncharacterized protein n=1 Tax=Conservatibacter flavescens TaxID=28161 RepID=A0A2M8S3H3_9PAST|nr:hypothetical protein [Conservatibacter flavescens]PJG85713.1 hypothetical protein CVP05_05005 [Conservatibacter flavescens]